MVRLAAGVLLSASLITFANSPSAFAESAGVSASQSRRGDAHWQLSIQGGAGMLDEAAAAVVKPRVALQGDQHSLILSAPIYVQRPSSGVASERWLRSWDNPERYTSMIERLRLETPKGALRLELTPLRARTLGSGALVDAFESSLDPALPRTGARFDLRAEGLEVHMMVDSIGAPQVLAARVQLAPVRLAGSDPKEVFALALEAAFDPEAPSIDLETQESTTTPVAAGLAEMRLTPWRSTTAALAFYGAAGVLSHGGRGGHVGVQWEYRRDPLPGANGLVLRVEGVKAGTEYAPAYFDQAYSVERASLPRRNDLPKHRRALPDAWYARARLDARLGAARFGASTQTQLEGRTDASLYVGLSYDRWTLQTRLLGRRLGHAREWFTPQHILLDASARVWGHVFAWSTLHHGRRVVDTQVEPVTDWMAGVGYGWGNRF